MKDGGDRQTTGDQAATRKLDCCHIFHLLRHTPSDSSQTKYYSSPHLHLLLLLRLSHFSLTPSTCRLSSFVLCGLHSSDSRVKRASFIQSPRRTKIVLRIASASNVLRPTPSQHRKDGLLRLPNRRSRPARGAGSIRNHRPRTHSLW